MRLAISSLFTLLPILTLSSPTPAPPVPAQRLFGTFAVNTIFTPPADWPIPRTLYARSVQLENGVLLATWENYSPEPPPVYFPIFKSVDGGVTWKHISNVTDQVNGWGLRYQPFLYELPERIGEFPAGTVILSGSSIPTDLSVTKIDMYASCDKGYTWKFVSSVATGGRAIPNNGETPVWEPFLMVYNHQLVNFYSDQRDPLYGQKLVHQVSPDLVNWGPVVNDVRHSVYTDRPGMTTVVKLPNGKYMMTYEYGGGGNYSNYQFPVYYRISDSPLTFDSATDYAINPGSGHPNGSPYLVWSPVGGKNGTLVVSAGNSKNVWVNKALGDVNSWTVAVTPQPIAYTRSLRVMNNPNHLLILGGGVLSGTANNVSLSVIDMP